MEDPREHAVFSEDQILDRPDFMSEFECCVCMELPRQPVVTSCNHIFCGNCIRTALSIPNFAKRCPFCRNPFGAQRENANANVNESDSDSEEEEREEAKPYYRQLDGPSYRLYARQRVKCDNHTNGCESILSISDLSDHFGECAKQPVPCTNEGNGCDMVMNREGLREHVLVCAHRVVRCEPCRVDVLASNLEEHKAGCHVLCPHCRTEMCQQSLASHTKNTCTEIPITCPFDGCNENVPRGKMNEHIEKEAGRHLVLCGEQVAKRRKREEELSMQVQGMRALQEAERKRNAEALSRIDNTEDRLRKISKGERSLHEVRSQYACEKLLAPLMPSPDALAAATANGMLVVLPNMAGMMARAGRGQVVTETTKTYQLPGGQCFEIGVEMWHMDPVEKTQSLSLTVTPTATHPVLPSVAWAFPKKVNLFLLSQKTTVPCTRFTARFEKPEPLCWKKFLGKKEMGGDGKACDFVGEDGDLWVWVSME